MKVKVDRFEENFAIVELPDGKLINAPKVLFEDCFEGDTVIITADKNATQSKQSEIKNKMNKLFGK